MPNWNRCSERKASNLKRWLVDLHLIAFPNLIRLDFFLIETTASLHVTNKGWEVMKMWNEKWSTTHGHLYLESANVCPGYRHLGIADVRALGDESHLSDMLEPPNDLCRHPGDATPPFTDIQELPSDLLRRATSCGERPLAASDLLRRATSWGERPLRRATPCGERPLAASDLLRRATSCGERPLAASDLLRRATSCGERPLEASDLLRRASSCGERPLAASDLLRRATSFGERPLAASDLFRRATSCGERPLAASDLLRRATSCSLLPIICIWTHRLNFSHIS